MIIDVNHVTVDFIVSNMKYIGLKEYFINKIKGEYKVRHFKALNDVSFSIDQGDMLGIVGTNGAGKSTLLKVVSGIIKPITGNVITKGKIAALLELASGFDGDLTVRENTYLRGAMLGYTRAFMDEKYKEIIQFAELGEFEDRPFKHLSSGMKSRLAFSIACLVKPDILILDEVLSVGDGRFREKSEKKMKEIIHNGAATILVSHSLKQIRDNCNKVMWLDHGKVKDFGETDKLCDEYQKFLDRK